MPTENIYIGTGDGWVEVASANTEVRVSGFPHSHPYYLWADSAPPTATDEGILMCHHPFQTTNPMTDTLYARIVNPVPNAKNNDGKIRLDIFTIV